MAIFTQPGQTFDASLTDAPTGLVGTLGVQVINPPAGTVMTARTTAGIVEQPAGSGIYHTSLTAPEALDTYSLVWDTGGATPVYATEDLVVSGFAFPTSTFATVADVQAACDTDAEDARIEFLLDRATAMILALIGKDLDWLADEDSVIPTMFRFVTVDMVCRALHSQSGIESTTERLGEYSITERSSTVDLYVTGYEELLLRRLVWGTGSTSVRIGSFASDLYPDLT